VSFGLILFLLNRRLLMEKKQKQTVVTVKNSRGGFQALIQRAEKNEKVIAPLERRFVSFEHVTEKHMKFRVR
jgi:hypothetical protein